MFKPWRIIGPWHLKTLKQIEPNGLKVFSCFHCGGGSSMGYKLAGYDVLGGVEIDKDMMKVYRTNHNPKHSYLMGVQDFIKIPDSELPESLFELDILDGSPPCSAFSTSGKRDKVWGKKKHFREGQSEQVLDDLFFSFIKVAKKLQPKVVVSENVKGLLIGKAKGYVKQIIKEFDEAGYDTQVFLLNSCRMGVPQRRERSFFISRRKDLNQSKIRLSFDEETIPFSEIDAGWIASPKRVTEKTKGLWIKCKPGDKLSTVHPKGSRFNWYKIGKARPLPTIASMTAVGNMYLHPEQCRPLEDIEYIHGQSFPDDFNFLNQKAGYIIGMSVPPFMTQRISLEIGRQWFNVDYDTRRCSYSERFSDGQKNQAN